MKQPFGISVVATQLRNEAVVQLAYLRDEISEPNARCLKAWRDMESVRGNRRGGRKGEKVLGGC